MLFLLTIYLLQQIPIRFEPVYQLLLILHIYQYHISFGADNDGLQNGVGGEQTNQLLVVAVQLIDDVIVAFHLF